MEPLETIEIGPEQGATASVIWMHGLGADGHDFEPIAPYLGLPSTVRFIFPHAPMRPVTINAGMVMRAWYDIMELGGKRQDEEGIITSAAQISDLIRIENEHGVPTDRIVLAGFSQGGAMALYTGLRYPQKLAALVVLSAYMPLHEKTEAEMNRDALSIPMFLGHGMYDPMLPMPLGTMTRDGLLQAGADVEWHEYPIPHSVCPEEIQHIGAFLKKALNV
ncbi:MAG: alpha/beta fold hydrolase [Acidobacteriota bacterium]|nr:alpha/beta fold hydrolase [Acidobacteriota bacterium]